MASPRVTVQVLTYNGRQWIERCLASLLALEYPNYMLQVVDNASTDGTPDWIEAYYPNITLIRNQKNVGFGAGHNVGIQRVLKSNTDYVWLMNQDAWVASDALTTLVETMEREQNAAMVSPVVLLPDQRGVWFGGGRIDWLRMRAEHIVSPDLNKPYETEYISGCAPLVRVSALQKVGLFDEDFFLYYEDADLSLRMRQVDLQLLMVPEAQVFHAEVSTTDNPHKLYWLVRSGLIFFRKHTPFYWRIPQAFYLFARRLKNRFDLFWKPTLTAKEVARAYRDYRRDYPLLSFPRRRESRFH